MLGVLDPNLACCFLSDLKPNCNESSVYDPVYDVLPLWTKYFTSSFTPLAKHFHWKPVFQFCDDVQKCCPLFWPSVIIQATVEFNTFMSLKWSEFLFIICTQHNTAQALLHQDLVPTDTGGRGWPTGLITTFVLHSNSLMHSLGQRCSWLFIDLNTIWFGYNLHKKFPWAPFWSASPFVCSGERACFSFLYSCRHCAVIRVS